jgi:Fe-S-cluster containining protein
MQLPARDTQLVQIVDSGFADAARRAGPHLVCRAGCTQCCYGAFRINALDAVRLRAGMATLRASNAAAAETIESRARAWLAEHEADFPGDAATGILGTSEADLQRFEDYAWDAPCPALDLATGLCGVYAWRPMTCRVFGPPIKTEDESGAEALGHCELCFTAATHLEVAACEMPVPHELESEILDALGAQAETIVAFALLP